MLESKRRVFRQYILGLAITVLSSVAFAENAPVESLTSPLSAPSATSENYSDRVQSASALDTSSLPLPQRVDQLEQQLDNLVQMNLPQQIAELQQQVEKLNGQLEEQAHQFDVLSRQQQHVEALPPTPVAPPLAAAPVSPPPPPENNAAVTPVQIPVSNGPAPQTDSAAYENAFNLLANKQVDAAANAFRQYIKLHPDGQFLANAHYWLGEIYLQQKNMTQSELEFNYVVQQYATSGKVADAQLKLAILHAQQGKTDQARQELKTLMARFPGSTAAQLAAIQLQQLNTNSGQ